MGQFVCKLLTDDGEFCADYDTCIDQFITCARRPSTDFEEHESVRVPSVFELQSAKLEKIDELISKLESGTSLNVTESVALDNFHDFLEGTVANQQYDYAEISDEIIESWVCELGLRNRFPSYSVWEIITDCGMYVAFQGKAMNARVPYKLRVRTKRPTVGQNKVAGRYLRALATIANVFGPNRTAPDKIVDRFYEQLLTRKVGT